VDVDAKVREANPLARLSQLNGVYGDVADRLLREIDAKTGRVSGVVPVQQRPALVGKGWVVAATAAIVTIAAVGALTLLIANSGRQDFTGPVPDPIDVVNAQYDALNARDFDAWIGHFSDEAVIFPQIDPRTGELRPVDARDPTRAYGFERNTVINGRVEIVFPCRRVATTPQGETQVECTITQHDDFHDPAGITTTRTETFNVDQQGLISAATATTVAFTQPGVAVFRQEFWAWLEQAYPTVFTEIKPPLINNLPSDPAHVRIALSYVTEFVAQSDRYPVADDS
jgi:hypothetical protein